MSYIDFDFSTKGLAINVANGVIISDNEGLLVCKQIETPDISNNSITLAKLDPSILSLIKVSDNNESTVMYPTFTSAVNNGLYVDSTTGPLTYIPSSGILNCPSLQVGNIDIGMFNTLRTGINPRYATIPIMDATATHPMSHGVIFLQALYMLNSSGITSSSVYITSTTAGLSCQMALYNKLGVRLGVSNTMTTGASAGLLTFSWSSLTPPSTDMYYIAFLALNSNTSNSNALTIQTGVSNPVLNIGIPVPAIGSLGYISQTYGSELIAMPATLTLATTASTFPLFIIVA